MKKLRFLLLALFALALSAQAQVTVITPQVPKPDSLYWTGSIALMPLSFLGDGLELAAEFHVPNSLTSVRFNAGYFLGTNPYFYDIWSNYSGFRGEAQVRFHFIKSEYQKAGFYMGPYVQYKSISLDRTFDLNDGIGVRKESISTNAVGLGLIFGYEERFANRLLIDFYVGGGLLIPSDAAAAKTVNLAIVNPYSRGISLHGGIGFGLLPRKRPLR
jgi:hypothetical protein